MNDSTQSPQNEQPETTTNKRNPDDLPGLTMWGVAEERDGRTVLVDPRTGAVVWPQRKEADRE